MGADLGTIGEGFLALFNSFLSLNWPVEFFRKGLGMVGNTVLGILPVLLILYLAFYLVCLISSLTMRAFQGKKSVFSWKRKIVNFFLTLLPFVIFQMLLGVCREMGEAAATVEGSFSFTMSGLFYLGELFEAVHFWRIILLFVYVWLLIYPLSQVWKCLTSYESVGVGIMWTVFDVGLGFACAACLLLGMDYGQFALYLLVPVLLILNHFGEKKEPKPVTKKTAEIYTTP